MLHIDHVVLGVRDLGETAERFWKEYGLASVEGGRHEAWGTGNRIVPLGDEYVELLGVVDHEAAERSGFGAFIQEITLRGDRWYTVAIRDDDLDATAGRLGLQIEQGDRRHPDGRIVRWRRGLLEDPRKNPWLPFFIEWDVPQDIHPGRSLADHRVPVTGISWVEIGAEGFPHDVLDGSDLPLRIVDGDPGVRAVALATEDGAEILLR